MKRTLFPILLIVITASPACADWLQFRGLGGSGVAPDKGMPVTWSVTENIAWKYEMPGAGGSSPIVVGDKVLLSCYSGYGLDRSEPGDQKNLTRHLVCVDRRTGKLQWKADFPAPLPEPEYSSYQALHGYASSTPISDGKHVWVFLGKAGVYCYDLDGKEKWKASVGTGTHGWGSGTSPILHKDLLIVNASVESGSLIAFDKNSGKERWNTKGMRSSWNTPILVKLANGTTELAVATQPKMLGFDPDTGKELWDAATYDWYVCPSLVAHAGILYGLQHSICVAVKAGGRGDVTESHVPWKKNLGAVVSSPLYHDGNLYWAANGTAFCVKASDGSTIYRERLKAGGDFYASPVLADGKLYYVSRSDGAYVLEAGPKFNLLAHNTLDKSTFNAGPAVSGSQLFLRSDRYLYCIGKEK
ncbi:MAG: serine/threonine protein kinase [Gemmataceae bacterium]|nr:serine/threonine protein kinase [Gemmataceae bacterium]